MNIDQKYKMELLGMITAIGFAHEKETEVMQQTIYGYPVEYLVMIANVAREQNISPEDAVSITADVKTVAKMITEAIEKAQNEAVIRVMYGERSKE